MPSETAGLKPKDATAKSAVPPYPTLLQKLAFFSHSLLNNSLLNKHVNFLSSGDSLSLLSSNAKNDRSDTKGDHNYMYLIH